MILEQFQLWSRTAPAESRADGVRVLARAILQTDLGPARSEAITVLTGFLDDPSPVVRSALAEAVAADARAPHHLVLALADDQPRIAAIVLGRSPVLSDAELVDCAATAAAPVQVAIAGRSGLSAGVAAAIAEVAAAEALTVLANNPSIALGAGTIRRMVERCGDDARLREALLTRSDLPVGARLDLVGAASRSLAALVGERGWMGAERMERVGLESRDRAAVIVSADATEEQRVALARHLRGSGQLTVGLAFRAILSGEADLFLAVMCELTGLPRERVRGLLRGCGSGAFAALCRDAGLPEELLPAFRAALRAAEGLAADRRKTLSLAAVERVIAACEGINDGALDAFVVMLRRFEAEAARDEARLLRETLATRQTPKAEPLLLADVESIGSSRSSARLRAAAPGYTIDLAAIEAQLCAA